MVFVYFFIVGFIEIVAFIFYKRRRKKIEKDGMYTDAIIRTTDIIMGKPNRYRFEVEFYDMTKCKKVKRITVNEDRRKNYKNLDTLPIIYMESSGKIYLQKTSFSETVLSIIVIIITFLFSFLCIGW